MKRDATNDIMKAVCIIGMVWCHAQLPQFVAVPKWFCLFIIGVFLMSFGWFYRCGDGDPSIGDVGVFVWRRIKRIWIPWVVWGGIFLLLHDVLLALNVYPRNPDVAGWCWSDTEFCAWGGREMLHRVPWLLKLAYGGSIITSGFWFLRSLFFASIAYCVTDTVARKFFKCELLSRTVMTLVAMSALLIGKYLYYGPLLQFDRIGGAPTLTAFGLVHLGVMLKWMDRERNPRSDGRAMWVRILIVLGCASFLWWQSLGAPFVPGANGYSSITRLLICSLAGWFMLKTLAGLIAEMKLGRVLAYVGRHTMPILIFHLLAFKLVSVAGVLAKDMDFIWIGGFPTTFHSVWWGFAYALAGIALPLAASEVFHGVMDCMRSAIGKRGGC